MRDNSFISFIILLAIFLVLPAVMRLLGRYTLDSKEADKKQRQDSDLPDKGMHEYLEDLTRKHDAATMEKPDLSNKPITPKWF